MNPFETTVPFWGQTSQILSSLVPQKGTAVLTGLNKTYGTHEKKLHISLFLLTTFGSIRYGPP